MASPKRNHKITDRGLIIFIKNPEAGNVKTRLAASVGDKEALRIYKQLLSHTKEVASSTAATKYLYYSRFIADDDWSKNTFTKKLQSGADLGARMYAAFDEVLKEKEKVIIIGSDCAQLSYNILNNAFDELDIYDMVIGPTFDGGYYLIGMKDFHPTLFQEMTWSMPNVFDTTMSRINELNLSIKVLKKLLDIDTLEDWKQINF